MVLWLEVQAIQILTMMLDQITNQMKLQQITMLVSKAFLLSLSKTLELILNKEIIEKIKDKKPWCLYFWQVKIANSGLWSSMGLESPTFGLPQFKGHLLVTVESFGLNEEYVLLIDGQRWRNGWTEDAQKCFQMQRNLVSFWKTDQTEIWNVKIWLVKASPD